MVHFPRLLLDSSTTTAPTQSKHMSGDLSKPVNKQLAIRVKQSWNLKYGSFFDRTTSFRSFDTAKPAQRSNGLDVYKRIWKVENPNSSTRTIQNLELQFITVDLSGTRAL